MQSDYNILSYLRSKPKHSRADGEIPFDAAKQFANMLQNIKDDFGETSKYIEQYNKILAELDSVTSITNRSLGISVGLYEEYRNNIVSTIEKMTWLEQRNKNLAKALNLNSDAAKKFADTLRNLNVGLGDDKLFKFTVNLNKLTGGFIKTDKATNLNLSSQIKVQRYLIENLDLSEDQANQFTLFAAAQKKSADVALESTANLANAFADLTGLEQTQAQIMILGDIADLSSEIRNQYSQVPGLLESAVLKSRLLGVSMQQLYSTGKGLLDIESAVGNEIELQLLSGRKLLAENSKGQEVNFMAAYRDATLRSDAKEQQILLNDMLLKEGETLKTNFMYREKMASAIGMSTEELMNAVEKANLIEQLGMSDLIELDAKDLEAKILELKKSGKYDKKLDDLLQTTTTKTISEQYLESIDSKISQFILQTIKDTEAKKDTAKAFDFTQTGPAAKLAEQFSTSLTTIAEQFTQTKFTKAIANLQNVGSALNLILDPVKDIMPNTMNQYVTAISEYSSLGTKNLNIEGSTAVGPITTTTTQKRDAILFDPMDEVVTVASTDRGQLENTVNNMMSGNVNNNTNVNIDYNAMANAIATAMTRVKLNINESNNYRNTFNA